MPSTRSSAPTKCISDVPGLAKQTSTPPLTKVRTRLSAPFIVQAPEHKKLGRHRKPLTEAKPLRFLENSRMRGHRRYPADVLPLFSMIYSVYLNQYFRTKDITHEPFGPLR